MDYNEIKLGMVNRHPWELSRTQMLLKKWKRYLDKIAAETDGTLKYVNVGAGDMFFDDILLEKYPNTELYADDLGYDTKGEPYITEGKKHLTNDLDSLDESLLFDWSMMMDSLEYMPNDKAYVTKLMNRVKPGGYLFFTLPAYMKLFSDHDRHVGNLRRYDRKKTEELFSSIDGLEVVYSRHFYFSLYLVRLFQVLTKAPIDPDQKVTTGWKHKENSLVTKLVKGVLNLDYRLGKHFPGLSLMIICRRK